MTHAADSLEPEAFSLRARAALCQFALRCGEKYGVSIMPALCHPRVRSGLDRDNSPRDRGIAVLMHAPEARFDATAAAACLEALRTADCTIVNPDWQTVCAAVYPTLAETAARRTDGEACKTSVDCGARLGCINRVCSPLPGAGDPCAVFMNDDACLGDLYCQGGPGRYMCSEPVAIGEACGPGQECAPRSRCSDGRCVPVAEPGGACGPSAVCSFFFECRESTCSPSLDD